MLAIHCHDFIDVADRALACRDQEHRPVGAHFIGIHRGKPSNGGFPRHYSGSVHHATFEQILYREGFFMIWRMGVVWIAAPIIEDHERVVRRDGALRMPIEIFDLLLELVRRSPVIVSVEDGDVLAGGLLHLSHKGDVVAPVDI